MHWHVDKQVSFESIANTPNVFLCTHIYTLLKRSNGQVFLFNLVVSCFTSTFLRLFFSGLFSAANLNAQVPSALYSTTATYRPTLISLIERIYAPCSVSHKNYLLCAALYCASALHLCQPTFSSSWYLIKSNDFSSHRQTNERSLCQYFSEWHRQTASQDCHQLVSLTLEAIFSVVLHCYMFGQLFTAKVHA